MKLPTEVSYLKLSASKNFHYRFIAQGLDYRIVDDTMESIRSQSDWFPKWMAVGSMYRELGESALARGHRVTAGLNFIKATLGYHFAQFLHFGNLQEKERAQSAKLETHRQADELVTPRMQRLEVPFEGIKIPVVVRAPSETGSHPTVVLICGTDSTKEENFVIENEFLRRGIATVSFDGPGQGEVWPVMKMRPDYHKVVTTVIDAIVGHPGIDTRRLGLLGKSFGGFLGPAAAAHDERIKACAVNGGYFDTAFYDWSEPLRAVRFQYVLGAETLEDAQRMAQEYTLSGIIDRVRVPLLVIHGGRDKGVPRSVAKRMADNAAGPAEFVEFPDGIHLCHNVAFKCAPLTVDWFLDRLNAE